MAKGRKKKRRSSGGHPQRAKFRKAAHACQAKVRSAGMPAFSRESWREYGKCMKKAL